MGAVYLKLVVVASLLASIRADFLSQYLGDKTFGPYPGPCTIRSPCVGNRENMPESVQDLQICLCNDNNNCCGRLGDIFIQGEYKVWNLQCDAVSIETMRLDHTKNPTTATLDGILTISGLRQRCNFMADLKRAVFRYPTESFIGWLRFEVDLLNAWYQFEQSPSDEGTEIKVGAIARWENTAAMDTDIPIDITLPYSSCNIRPRFGLTADIPEDRPDWWKFCAFGSIDSEGWCVSRNSLIADILVGLFNWSKLVGTILTLLEAWIGGITCNIVEEIAFVNAGKSNQSPGPINVFWNEIKDIINEAAKGKPESIVETEKDSWILEHFPRTTQEELNSAIDLSTSTAAELVSVSLNDWLGGKTTETPPRLVINQMVDTITDPDGIFFSGNLRPSDYNVFIDADIADITVRINEFQFTDLNTFNKFEVLQNNYLDDSMLNRYRRTVKNSIGLDAFGIQFEVLVRLDRGDWVTQSCNFPASKPATCSSDSYEFTFSFYTWLKNIDINMDLTTAFNPSKIEHLQVGQFKAVLELALDKSGAKGTGFSAGLYFLRQCTAPAFSSLYTPSLSFKATEIIDPVVKDFGGDQNQQLNALVEDSVRYFADATRGAMTSKLEGFMQTEGRRYLNDMFNTSFVEMGKDRGTMYCPKFNPSTTADRYTIDFKKGLASYTYRIINEAIGGNPIKDSNSDINDLVDSILKYYEVKEPSLIFDSWNNKTKPNPTRLEQGTWELKDQYQETAKVPAYKKPYNYLWFSDFSVSNVNSIFKFTADYNDILRDIGLELELGLGGPLANTGETRKPLLFNLTFDIATDNSMGDLNEKWDFTFIIEEFDFHFVVNEVVVKEKNLNSLLLSQSQHIPCLLQGLYSILFPKEYRSSSIKTLDFDVIQVEGKPRGSGVPIVEALHGISSKLLDPDTADLSDPLVQKRIRTQIRFKHFINTLMRGAFGYGLDMIETVPESYKAVTPGNCLKVEDPLPTIPTFSSYSWPNFTYFSTVCLADVDKKSRLGVAQTEEVYVVGYQSETKDVYDLTTSTLIQTIQGLVATRSTAERVLFGLANSSDTLLSQYFELSKNDFGEDQVDLVFPLSKLGYSIESDAVIPGLILDLGVMRVEGIDRVFQNSYDVLNPVGTMTLRNKFRFDESTPLKVHLRSLWQMDNSAVGIEEEGYVQEWINTTFEVLDLDVAFDLIIAVDEEKFGNLTLLHMLRVDEEQTFFLSDIAQDCFLSTIFEGGLFISYLDIDVKNITGPSIAVDTNELISPAVVDLLDATVELLKNFYLGAIPSICDNCLKQQLNEYMADMWTAAQQESACPKSKDLSKPPLSGEDVFYRFNKAKDALAFQTFFNEYLSPNNYKVWNTMLESATAVTLFSVAKKEQIVYQSIPVIYDKVTYGSFDFQIAEMKVKNLDTFTNLKIFEPYFRTDIEQMEDEDRRRRLPYVNATADENIVNKDVPYMSLTQFTIEGPLEITADYDLNVTDVFVTDPDMRNNLRITLKATNVTFGLELVARINITKAMDIRFSSISSFNELPCLFVPFETLEPLDFNLTTNNLEVEIECLRECDLFKKYGLDKGGKLNNKNGQEISDLLNGLISWSTAYVDSRGAQSAIDGYLEGAEGSCATILGIAETLAQIPESQTQDIATVFGIIFLGASGVGGLLSLALFPAHKKRRQLVMSKTLGKYKGVTDESEIAGIMAMVELRMKSIFQHPITPNVAKYLVPLICILNVIGLVIAIVFSNAAAIVIAFTFLDQTTQRFHLVPFTIVSTINDMWNSGAWPLAVLIAVASCAWPVVKNLMLLGFWFCPSTIVRPKTRRWWIETLDILGKWSFLDVYVVVIMLAALRTYVSASYLSYTKFLDDRFFVADVNVVPQPGIVLLCIVAAASLLINHVIIVMHDRVEGSNNISEDKINGNHIGGKIPARAAAKRALMRHVFIGKDKNGLVRKVSSKGALGIAILCVLSALLVIIGISVPLIRFELNGLVGILLELFEENNNGNIEGQLKTKVYSVISLGTTLKDAPADGPGDRLVLVFFQFLYFLCVMVGPFATILLMSALFFMPHTLPNLKSLLFWTKIASYWSALDVLLVGLIATIIEIGPVTAYIVDFITNDVCGYVKGAIATIVEDSKVDGYCLDVVGDFEPTAAILFAGVGLQIITYYIITVLARAIIDDRYFASYHQLRTDVRPKRLGRVAKLVVRLFTFTFSAPDDGIQGVSSFMDLDNEEDIQYTEVERSACDKLNDWCCASRQGEEAADLRIEAWQKRFGVNGENGSPSSLGTANPVFDGSPAVSIKIDSPASSTVMRATSRVRSTSSESVDV